MNILKKIIEHKKSEVETEKRKMPVHFLLKHIKESEIDFKQAIKKSSNNQTIKLIAEIKKASPSKGLLRPNLEKEINEIIKIYNNHANAISVVADKKFFKGNDKIFRKVRSLTTLPILFKDFIIDEYQIYKARYLGADAILIICEVFNVIKNQNNFTLKQAIKTARSLKMNCLIETNNINNIKQALKCGADIIGINNRDLSTFKIDLRKTRSLSKQVPENIVKVSESGIKTKNDLLKLPKTVDAVLIGTLFMESNNIEKSIKTLIGKT